MKEKLKSIWSKAPSIIHLVWNKGAVAAILVILAWKYTGLSSDNPTPFAEVLYALILAGTVIVVSPIVRFLVFPNAAEASEKGKVKAWLEAGKFTPALAHYWFATFISYSITALCVSSLL
tara:strand:+ start:306 stop:665 length:360 start_codon:yes stop_codon:yes gene_type:complete